MSMLQKALTGAAVLAFILLAALACSKENIQEPVVLTGEVAIHEQDGIVFHGRITEWGKQEITDHGFLWDTDPGFKNPYKISLGSPQKADFSASPNSVLLQEKTYYFKAFLVTEKSTITGFNQSFFIADRNIQPVIESFDPKMVTWGDTITIRGKYFSPKIIEVKGFVGNKDSKIVSASDSLIRFVVPSSLDKVFSKITLNIAGFQTISADSMQLFPPVITDFSPKSAAYNQVIEIQGEHFNPTSDWREVFIGEKKASVVKATSKTIQARIPSGLPEGDHSIEVRVLGQKAFSDCKVYIAHPVITDFFPREVTWNDTITILGRNFSETPAQNIVNINSLRATVVKATKEELKVLFPPGLLNNGHNVSVSVNSQKIDFDGNLILKQPQIHDYSPTVAWGDEIIEISGQYFHPGNSNQLFFNNQQVTIVSSSPQSIQARIPTTLSEVENTITVRIGNQLTAVSPGKFELKLHEVTGLNITSGSRLNQLEIRGSGFNVDFYTKVLFGDMPMNRNRTFSTISAKIPFGHPSGSYPVSVEILGRTVTAPENFQLYEPFSFIGFIPSAAANPPIVFQLNDKFYIGGNFLSGYSSDFFEFHPETNTWIRKNNLPVFARNGATSFSAAGKAFLLNYNDLYEYVPETDQWIPKNPFPGTALNFPHGVSSDNYVYFVYGNSTEFNRYDPHNDSWIKLKDHPGWSLGAFFYDGKVYSAGENRILRSYNAEIDEWELEADFPIYIYPPFFSHFIHENILYTSGGGGVLGGYPAETSVYSYDLQSKTLKRITPLPAPLSRHFSIIYNQKIYIGGGGANNLYLFDPELLHPSEKF